MGKMHPKFRVSPFMISGLIALMLRGASVLPVQAEPQNFLMISVKPNNKLSSAKTVQAQVLVDAPISLVWATLTDYPDLVHIFPGYERTQVIQAQGDQAIVDVVMKVSAFLPTYQYQLKAQQLPMQHQLKLTRLSGDFKSLQAVYRLTPQNNGRSTLIDYNLNIDPGVALLGSHAIIRGNTERCLKALAQVVEKRARKREIGQR